MKPSNKTRFFGTVINVLGYRDGADWVALALEMDLRGYGKTWEDALADLEDLIVMQISFAHFKGHPEMIFKSAEPTWFQLFADVRRNKIEHELTATKRTKYVPEPEYQAGGLSLPPAHVIAQLQKGFSLSNV